MHSGDASNDSKGEVEAPPGSAPVPPKASIVRRIGNWFWQADDLKARRRSTGPQGEAVRRRAHLTIDAARRLEDSQEPFDEGIDAILCDLYRQSIHWSRCALSESETGSLEPKPWQALALVQPSLLGSDEGSASRVRDAVESGSYEGFAALSAAQQHSLLQELRRVASALSAKVEPDEHTYKRVWYQRSVRVGSVIVALGLSAGVALLVSRLTEPSRDIARGKPWHASSAYAGVATCPSPQQECEENADFFFHTNDEKRPWLEIDLGSAQAFSAVRVENRKDCCIERASPLTIEVSSDRSGWREVAHRDEPFTSWLATFPTTSARYVRVHLQKHESLHLQRVRVLR